ncbi:MULTISPECIES: CooT family nickel-binding protein [unclassified Archaeoglobus]|jgi:predicted RNA-binding protein|uniref:CooT family nickel-binding protein n=1 Tax=unclassified Archaeoglobus TaxID=2643606 RepID=UPI0025B8112E|nr:MULTISPECIES: CooT family nickel-binding protein [unclassified Archaeoglobus]
MCESKVLLSGSDETLMEDVVRIVVEGEKIKMWDILGDYREVKGRVVEMDLVGHKIVVEGYDES